MIIRVKATKSKQQVEKMVRDLPLVLSGKKKDIYGVRRAFWSGFAHSLYVAIFRAYKHKSRLTKDELGDSWPDITPETKAYRRTKNRRKGPLALLTSPQKKSWWSYYRKQKHYLLTKKKLPLAKAQAAAAGYAWNRIKDEGGKTLISEYGNKKLPVMIDTQRLLLSLTPGSFNGIQYRTRTRHQIFDITKTGLEMGTRVKYAMQHHQPKAKRVAGSSFPRPGLPQRRLWPVHIRPWVKNAMTAGVIAATRKFSQSV